MGKNYFAYLMVAAWALGMVGCKKNLETIALDTSGGPGVPLITCDDTVKHDDVYLLQGTVVDAEFDYVNHNIVIVTRDPGYVYTIGQNLQNTSQSSLTSTPTCISVAGNNQVAVIGYDGKVDFMDLKYLSRKGSVYVPFPVEEIAAVGQDVAYAYPGGTNSWEGEKIYRIGLSKKSVNKLANIKSFSWAKIKCPPPGEFLYISDEKSGLTKLAVESDSLKYLHSAYKEKHSYWYNLWVFEPENKIIGPDRTIYNTDLEFVGEFSGSGKAIKGLAFSQEKSIYYAILSDTRGLGEHQGSSEITVYNSKTLELLSKHPVPKISLEGACYITDANYLFLDDQLTNYYVIVEGMTDDKEVVWAVIKGSTEDLY